MSEPQGTGRRVLIVAANPDVLDAQALTLSEQGIFAETTDALVAASSVRVFGSVIALVIANLDDGDREPWFEPLRSACTESSIPMVGILGEAVTDPSAFVRVLPMPPDSDEFVRATLDVLSKLKTK